MIEFLSESGEFRLKDLNPSRRRYFPLVNEGGLLGFVTPQLQAGITLDQHSFLSIPLCTEDLHLSRASFNFWVTLRGATPIHWSATGQSVWQRADVWGGEDTEVKAGFLWHEVTRSNKKLGLKSRILNFIPSGTSLHEVMVVEITNKSRKKVSIVPTSAFPIFARSADNLRDHRHVTSLLQRIQPHAYGLVVTPTMTFNERGHRINKSRSFVLGVDGEGAPPVGFFPTISSFIGSRGDLEAPEALIAQKAAQTKVQKSDQGKEAIGALRFKEIVIRPGESAHYVFLIGIDPTGGLDLSPVVQSMGSESKALNALKRTQQDWAQKISQIQFETGDPLFNQWMKWVSVQPTLRKLFGNSFLPDFDYGRGGRGWRDLWQDCLALLLADPKIVRDEMKRNFGGVRLDGSNATIINRKRLEEGQHSNWAAEFVADRNNISRTWMDHGVWPCFTTAFYIHQSGDFQFLLEKTPYFNDGLQKTKTDHVYEGSILEHILIQTLVPFFNVGDHNTFRLEDADWNDGLDMAREKGESVAFTAMYGGNIESLVQLLESAKERLGWQDVEVAEEVILLMDRASKKVNYDKVADKQARLKEYRAAVAHGPTGQLATVPLAVLLNDLRDKAGWIRQHLNNQEWINQKGEGWFNGYYDNKGKRVEGAQSDGSVRMTLTGQVFPLLSKFVDKERFSILTKSIDHHLFDKSLGGYRLNTDFKGIQPDLGRAFSFAFGEKENGAVFSHMVVMYANALYQNGGVNEGHKALDSLYQMAKNWDRSGIYPGLPEYFNNEGHGRYCYLTGSASWYVMTLLTQVFGIRGESGDLVLAPKLVPGQFDAKGEARVSTWFAGVKLNVTYKNAAKVPYSKMRIAAVLDKEGEIPCTHRGKQQVLVQREILAQRPTWDIFVELKSAAGSQ